MSSTVADMKARYDQYQGRIFISPAQHDQLLRIGGND